MTLEIYTRGTGGYTFSASEIEKIELYSLTHLSPNPSPEKKGVFPARVASADR